jgi:beta-phosphoglucomutase-like phosphatase (HAD superfamily)
LSGERESALSEDGATTAVIFDCDGVLVDSEPISNATLAEVLTEIGVAMTPEQSVEAFLGRSWEHAVTVVTARLGEAPPADLHARYRKRLFARFDAELEPVLGIAAALDELDGLGLPRCVASSGSHERIRHGLAVAGLLGYFDDAQIFSAADVEHGKPAPDLFLHAAERMGFEPARTVVVEDSPAGVRAAVAAGMTVLGYAERTPAELLAREGAVVFDEMSMLPQLIRGSE